MASYKDKVSFIAEHIDNFGHYTVAIPALTSAFNLIFPRQDFQQFRRFFKDSENAMMTLRKHYNKLSKRYGVTIDAQTNISRNPNSLRSFGYGFLNKKITSKRNRHLNFGLAYLIKIHVRTIGFQELWQLKAYITNRCLYLKKVFNLRQRMTRAIPRSMKIH